ncbi:MAG: PBP1A family penicillin-binding protein [Proteobacteria bacterium]|nr:PBP1A family penicillin-binding protein [Pseudomonadota bacterium]
MIKINRRKILGLFAALVLLVFFGTYYYFTRDLPSLVRITDYQPNLVTKAYSSEGEVIGEFYIERRVVVPLTTMPKYLIDAFLAAEDSGFYEHEGVSYISIARAFYKNVKAGRIVQGGSTITQQVARSFFLSSEKKISRKIREVIMAYRIERELNKDEILNLYLNQIYLGNGAYGVQAAAETYFGKDVEGLTISEAALLAGLPKAPSKYSPYTNLERAKERQEFVLNRMVEEEYINPNDAVAAFFEELNLKPKAIKTLWAGPYFTEHVRRYIEEKYGENLLYKGGLNIYTTMDIKLQKGANEAVELGRRAYDKRRGYRGPLESLETADEIDEFRDKIETELERKPIEVGGIYKGVITSVDVKKKLINVDIGYRHGIINKWQYRWARVYNPESLPDGELLREPLVNFATGDVIYVRLRREPKDEDAILSLALEQESLVEAALISSEPETGYVRAMVGGSNFRNTQFNRAVQAFRQPGSGFKPIIYAAALDNEYTPATIVMDSPIVFEDEINEVKWRPRNYDEQFHGPTTIRKGLTKSRNIVTIKVLQDIGVARALDYAARFGITSPLAEDLSLALGSSALTLQEMNTVFATFANKGYRPDPIFITKITDKDGNVLEENIPSAEQVIDEDTAFIMANLLQGVVQDGTGRRAKALGRPAAGKTGTTNNLNDAWFIGFIPDLTATVWVGYDTEKELGKYETGSRAAIPIWLKYMQTATEGTPIKNFDVPDGIEFAKIDPVTGLLAPPDAEDVLFEAFKTGTAPTTTSSMVESTEKAQKATSAASTEDGAEEVEEETDEFDIPIDDAGYEDDPEMMQIVE